MSSWRKPSSTTAAARPGPPAGHAPSDGGRVRRTSIRDLLAVLRRKRGTPSWAVAPTGAMDLER